MKAIVAYDNLSAPGAAPVACKSGSSPRPASTARVPALGLSADYGLLPVPNPSEPDPLAKSAGSRALSKAGVDSAELIIRGGTHYEFSFLPNPAFGATLRGEDLVSWYTAAWLDKYVKGGDDTADARLLTDRWRDDAQTGAIDPDKDPNLFSRYYRSRIDVHVGDRRVTCEDVRPSGCAGFGADPVPGAYSFLASVRRADTVPQPGTPGSLTQKASLAPAGSTGSPPGGTGPPPEALPECRDTIPPVSRFTRSKSRLTRRAITLRGTSRDAGCDDQEGELRHVKVSVARQAGRLCRFLRARGGFSARRPCGQTSYLTARGTTSWSFTRHRKLRRGTYRLHVRGIDGAGNVERKSRGRTNLTLRVR